MRRTLITIIAALLVACARIENPTAPSNDRETTPTTPTVVFDTVEFRVFGGNLLTPATIKFTDPLNGLTLTTSSTPYFASVRNSDPSVFLFLEATAFGFSTSTLQVQIFVNGKLFREGSSVGSSLFAQASGTFRR